MRLCRLCVCVYAVCVCVCVAGVAAGTQRESVNFIGCMCAHLIRPQISIDGEPSFCTHSLFFLLPRRYYGLGLWVNVHCTNNGSQHVMWWSERIDAKGPFIIMISSRCVFVYVLPSSFLFIATTTAHTYGSVLMFSKQHIIMRRKCVCFCRCSERRASTVEMLPKTYNQKSLCDF